MVQLFFADFTPVFSEILPTTATHKSYLFVEKSDFHVLTLSFLLYVQFSLQKSIDRYKAHTKDNVNNKAVQQDVQVNIYPQTLG